MSKLSHMSDAALRAEHARLKNTHPVGHKRAQRNDERSAHIEMLLDRRKQA